MNNKVSIVVPIYNVKCYMKDCIESLLKQTYENLDIILIDDGSTDGSSELCEEYAGVDKRIKVVHKINGGLSSARNAGIEKASGDYIIFVDGDDYLAENAVEYLLQIENITCADIVQFRYLETEEKYSNQSAVVNGQYELVSDTKKMFEKLYEIGGEGASSCTKLYNIRLFDNLRFKEGILHEDEYMITYILKKARSIAYIPEQLYFYVMRQGSIINSLFNPRKLDVFIFHEERIKILEEMQYDNLLEKEYYREFFNIIHLFYEAMAGGYKKECKVLLQKLNTYINEGMYSAFGGINKIIYKLCRININAIYIFYFIDRIRHKEKYNGAKMEKNNRA